MLSSSDGISHSSVGFHVYIVCTSLSVEKAALYALHDKSVVGVALRYWLLIRGRDISFLLLVNLWKG